MIEPTTADGIRLAGIPRRFHPYLEPGAVAVAPEVWEAVLRVVDGVAAGRRPRGLVLVGPTGCGKSLAMAAGIVHLRRLQAKAREDGRRLPSGRFLSDSDIIRRARAAMEGNGDPFTPFVNGLVDRLNLVGIDDLAAGTDSPYTPFEARILGDVVDLLHREAQPVIITTNKAVSALGRILGDRIPSRLVEMAGILTVDGADRRLQGAAAEGATVEGRAWLTGPDGHHQTIELTPPIPPSPMTRATSPTPPGAPVGPIAGHRPEET